MVLALINKPKGQVQLAADLSAAAVTLDIPSGQEDLLPSTFPFLVTFEFEIIQFDSAVGTVGDVYRYNVTRGRETDLGAPSATAHAEGTPGAMLITAGTIEDLQTPGSTSFTFGEVANETPNGVTVFFTVDNAYVANSTQVYRDGQLMTRGAGADYIESNPTLGQIQFTTAPLTGSAIVISYQTAVSVAGNADTLDGFHANATATASTIPVLTASALMPADSIGASSFKAEAWTSWSPSYSNLTVGNGTVTARYIQLGKTVMAHYLLLVGNTTTIGNDVTISFPVAPSATYGATQPVAIGTVTANDAGTALYGGLAYALTDINIRFFGAPLTATFPFVEAAGDALMFSITYEAA